jgi:hypothetical protein
VPERAWGFKSPLRHDRIAAKALVTGGGAGPAEWLGRPLVRDLSSLLLGWACVGWAFAPARQPSPALQRMRAAATDHAANSGRDANTAVMATRNMAYFLAAMRDSTCACPHASAAACARVAGTWRQPCDARVGKPNRLGA